MMVICPPLKWWSCKSHIDVATCIVCVVSSFLSICCASIPLHGMSMTVCLFQCCFHPNGKAPPLLLVELNYFLNFFFLETILDVSACHFQHIINSSTISYWEKDRSNGPAETTRKQTISEFHKEMLIALRSVWQVQPVLNVEHEKTPRSTNIRRAFIRAFRRENL